MKRLLRVLLVVAFAVWVLVPTAHADLFQMRLSTGATTVDITDGGIGDADTRSGVIRFDGILGNFDINVTTGITKPFAPDLPPWMDLNSVNASSTGGGTLEIWLTATEFYTDPAWTSAYLESSWGGTTGGSVTLVQTFDPDNVAFGGTSTYTLTSGPKGPGAFSDTLTRLVPLDSEFSLTEHVTIVHGTPFTSTSFDAESTVVPVPGAVLLGMLGLGAAGVKLRKYV